MECKHLPAALGAIVALLLLLFSRALPGAAPAYAATLITSNPYDAGFGPPNCTWYAWQRLHDAEGIDAQIAGNAADWASAAQQPERFWSEKTRSFVPVQIHYALPAVGDVMVLPVASTYALPYHVAFVEGIEFDPHGNFNGFLTVSEQNFSDWDAGASTDPYPYTYHRRQNWKTLQAAEGGQGLFLHFPSLPQSSRPGVLEVGPAVLKAHHLITSEGDEIWPSSASDEIFSRGQIRSE